MKPVRALSSLAVLLAAAAAFAGSHSAAPQFEGVPAVAVTPAAVALALDAQIQRFAPLSASPQQLAQALDDRLLAPGAAPAEQLAGQYLLGALGSPKTLPVVRELVAKSGVEGSERIAASLSSFAAPYQDPANRQAFLEELYRLPGQLDVQAGQFDPVDVKRRFDRIFDNSRPAAAAAPLSVAAYYGSSQRKLPEEWTLQPGGSGEILVRFKRRQRGEVGGVQKDFPVTDDVVANVLKRRGLREVGVRDGVYRVAPEDGRAASLAADQLAKEDAVLMAVPARPSDDPGDRVFVRFKGLVGQNEASDALRRRGLRIVDVQAGVDDLYTVVPVAGAGKARTADAAAEELLGDESVLLAVPASWEVPEDRQLVVRFKDKERALIGGDAQEFVVNDTVIASVLRRHGLRLLAVRPDGGYLATVTGRRSAAQAIEELAKDGAVSSASSR